MWNTLSLRAYCALHTPLPATMPEARLRLALAVVRGVPPNRLRHLRGAGLARAAAHQLAFMQQPPEPQAPKRVVLGQVAWTFAPDPATLPLGAWVVLERQWLQQPQRLHGLAAGQWGQLAELLAVVATPEGTGFDTRRLPAHALALGLLPVPVALGWLLATLRGVQAVQAQYPSLFAPDEAEADPSHIEGSNTASALLSTSGVAAYARRWGWAALLAELCGGVVRPSLRHEWMAAPAHLAFQELARLREAQALAAPQVMARAAS